VAAGADELYDAFAAEHGRRHASLSEYEHRRAVFHGNRQLIEAHNSAGHNFTLAINRFADWTQVCLRAYHTMDLDACREQAA
jgi:hypothetical protein